MIKYRIKPNAMPTMRDLQMLFEAIAQQGVYFDVDPGIRQLEPDPDAHGREVLWQQKPQCQHIRTEYAFLSQTRHCLDCGATL